MVSIGEKGSFAAKLRNLPLRYRLILPFLTLAFLGTFSLTGLSILSQNELIRQEETDRLHGYYRALQHTIELQGRWAVSLASSFARNPEISAALASRSRLRLIELCYPAYLFMKQHYGISQFNFHTLPPRNFLRLQRLYEFGDSLEYRKTIRDAVDEKRETFGLEAGLTGYGIRGVAPVFVGETLVGTIEIGFGFGSVFFQGLKKQFGIETSLLLPKEGGGSFDSESTTFSTDFVRDDPAYEKAFRTRTPQFLTRIVSDVPYAIMIGAVADYKDNTVGLVEFCVDRSDTLTLIVHYRNIMLGIGLLGMLLSVGAIFLLSAYFTRPIGKMIKLAEEISGGRPVHPLEVKPSGELGILAHALDDMLEFLQASKQKIEEYADNLEHMVHERTRALRESEEKYRTLVENVPLVVYRLLGDGRTIYINHFIESLMGVSEKKALEDPYFWKEKVHEEDRERVWPLMDRCLKKGSEFKAEYRLSRPDGKQLHVLDHALPVLDERGKVETVDGFMANVTDRYCLQQQIIQTEELKTINEISARLAHEIRNPLVAAGGFARRLLRQLPEGDPNRAKVDIIILEVARLERILERTLAYLRPFDVLQERSSLNDLVVSILDEQRQAFEMASVRLETICGKGPTEIPMDRVLLKKALTSIVQALLDHCGPDSVMEVRTHPVENGIQLVLTATGAQFSEDDIEHFFYPFIGSSDRSRELDLPVAKMIIHKHRGLISLRPLTHTRLTLDINLPR